MDPKTSRWLSADPAMYQGDYIPSAPVNDEARKRNGNLPGMGGVFNYVNLHVYHYGGNNPIKYVDPDGESATVVGFIIVGIILLLRGDSASVPQRNPTAELSASVWNTYLPDTGSSTYIGPAPIKRSMNIGTNFLLKIGDVFPTPNDLNFEDMANLPLGVELSSFATSAFSKAMETAPDGSYVGDIRLNYESNSKGEVTRWGINLTYRNERGTVGTYSYSKSEAMEIMNKLKESNSEHNQEVYRKIQSIFD
jgi:hypothetical protein